MTIKLNKTSIILGATALILLVPLVAMQFTEEVNWSFFDFLVGGALISGLGFALSYALTKLKNSPYKIPIILALVVTFLLIWGELAVGLIGTPFAGS